MRDPHSSVGTGHAVVSSVTITGHSSLAVACRRCDSLTVPPRPLCIPTLYSYAPQSPVTCHLPWHDVRQFNIFEVLVKLSLKTKSLLIVGEKNLQIDFIAKMYFIQFNVVCTVHHTAICK